MPSTPKAPRISTPLCPLGCWGSLWTTYHRGLQGVAGLLSGLLLLGSGPGAMALCGGEIPALVEEVSEGLGRSRLGIHIATLEGETLYQRDGEQLFLPASTLKLFTTAAALDALGPEARVTTTALGIPLGPQRWEVRVVGAGDPSFGSEAMDALARQIGRQVGAGGTVVTLIGDDSALPGAGVNPHWEWEDVLAGYGAAANGLIWQGNALGLTLTPQGPGELATVTWPEGAGELPWQVENQVQSVPPGTPEFLRIQAPALGSQGGGLRLRLTGQLVAGSEPALTAIAVPNPGERFLQALAQRLTQQGITVEALAVTFTPPPASPTLALGTVSSPPLAEWLPPINRDSNNLYAEALLHHLGRQGPIPPGQGVAEAGVAQVRAFATGVGIPADALVMVDGSGLARKNLTTPAALVTLLQAMARHPQRALYQDSLAIAGVSGTLRRRFQDTPAAGRILAKTGSFSRNGALAGYVFPPHHPPLAFAIVVNNLDQPGAVVRQTLDAIAAPLATLERCP